MRSIFNLPRTIYAKIFVIVLFAVISGSSSFAEEQCRKPNDAELHRARLYISRKLDVSESDIHVAPVASTMRDHCFTRLEVTVANGLQPFVMYLSPDHHVLTAEIYNVTDNPAIAAETERETTVAALNKNILIDAGSPNSPFSLTVFLDFECPFCRRYNESLSVFQSEQKDNAHVIYRFFPLESHPWALSAAVSSACVAQQSPAAFFALMNEFYSKQSNLSLETLQPDIAKFLASQPGMNEQQYKSCIESGSGRKIVDADIDLGKKLGVQVTPTSFVNGRKVEGVIGAVDLVNLTKATSQPGGGLTLLHNQNSTANP